MKEVLFKLLKDDGTGIIIYSNGEVEGRPEDHRLIVNYHPTLTKKAIYKFCEKLTVDRLEEIKRNLAGD
jgi:hypothetical protein